MGKRNIPKQAIYNRPSLGMQRNLARKEMKTAGVIKKRDRDAKRLMSFLKIGGIIWGFASVIAIICFGLKAAFFSIVFAIIVLTVCLVYIDNLDKDVVRVYKDIGVTKEYFLTELRRRGVNEKKLGRLEKLWDRTKAGEEQKK